MKEIYFATKNTGKVNSLSSVFSKYNIKVIRVPLELPEPRTDDIEKIAKEKVLFAYNEIRKPCVALDSGFYIDSLNGFPKTFVNFALETIGIKGILKLVDKERECKFKNCLAYLDDSLAEPLYFSSDVEGTLAREARGKLPEYAWSKLFLVFIPSGEKKTLAEMTPEDYKAWRVRRYKDSYATKFAEWFSDR